MVVVAVAGGNGGVGKTIVEQLQLHPEFETIILSRSARNNADNDLKHVQVDYNDVPSLTHILDEHKVHTIISAINMVSDETSQAQLNLIQAAEEAKSTKRFIPSEWGIINTPELIKIEPTVKWWVDSAKALKKSSLKFTRFVNGFYMDYWGMPHVKTHLAPFAWGIDLLNRKAAIPGDGNNVLSFTYSIDMARHVVKTLELEDWPEFSIVVGEDMTFNQLLKLAEELRGSKFEVVYDDVDKLQAGNPTILQQSEGCEIPAEVLHQYGTMFGLMVVSDLFHMPKDNRLSDRFPDLKPITVKEFMTKAWSGRG